MNRSTQTCFILVVYVLFVLFFDSAHAQEKKNLRIVFVSLSWNNQLPIRVAIAKGFFKDQGLTLEPILVRGGPIAITALISGNVDFASVGGAQAPIRSNARGLDLHIIASLSNYTNYTLLGSKDAKSVEELRGKIIGVTGAGAFSDFAIRIYLKRHNLDPDKDVTLRAIGGTALRAIALEKGLIAAAPFSAEDTIRLLDKGFPMIVNLNEALKIPQSVFVTRGEVLQKYPETTKRFLKAVILGMQFARYNKQEAIKRGMHQAFKVISTLSTAPMISSVPATRRTSPSLRTEFRSCSTKTSVPASSTRNSPSTASSTTGSSSKRNRSCAATDG